jgi:hypothetical protein
MPDQTITTNLEFVTSDQASAGLEQIDQRLKNIQADADKTKKNVGNISESFTPLLRTGRELERAGMGLSRLGDFLGNDQIKKVGELTSGIGGLAMSLGEVQKVLMLIKAGGGIGTAIGIGGAVIGGVAAGAGIYDATIGKQQGTDAGTILKQAFADMSATFTAQAAQLTRNANYTEEYTKALNENAHAQGLITEEQYKAVAANYDPVIRASQAYNDLAKSVGAAAAAAQMASTNIFGGMAKGVADIVKQQSQRGQPEFQAGAKEFQNYQQKLRDLEKKAIDDRADVVRQGEKEISDITRRYYQDTARAAQQLQKEQMKIVNDGIKQENKEEQAYYRDRAKQAAQFGVEMQRLEEDHQIQMQRMSQDHNIRLRRLADSRDALAIEDEQQNYEVERSRAEQDYQKEVARKNQDLARTLAEQDAAFNEQRQQRQQDRQQQLADLKAGYDEQQAERRQQFNDEIKARRDDNAARLSEIDRNLGEERRNTNEQWTQWREEHGLFLEGEKTLWDNYLEYTYQQLEKALKGTTPASDYGGGVSSHAEGGYQTYTGLAKMHEGEFVLNRTTTQNLERMVGGQLNQTNVVNSTAKGDTVINVSQSFSGQEAKPEVYRQIVYDTVTDLFRRARQ